MKTHSLLFFVVFICSLVLGYTVSTRFYPMNNNLLPPSMRWVTTESQNSIQTMNNGQRSILLVSATSLDTPDQHLEGIWLVSYFSTDSTLQWLPIFPAGKRPVSAFEQQLELSFKVDQTNGVPVLNQEFTHVLVKNNYWWSGYIVFDQVALTKIIDRMGGMDWNGRILTGEQALSEFPSGLDNPQGAYSSQILLLQSACRKFQEITPGTGMPLLGSLLHRHILSDLDSSQLQKEIQGLYAGGRKPTCRFPTLDISQLVQK
jgi:hypothetical protein